MGSSGYTETEKIKILYEESLIDIRALTTRLEIVAEKVKTSSVTVEEIEKQVESSITKAATTFQVLADKEMKRAGQQAILTMADRVGAISQQLAGDTAASERYKSFAWAAGFMTFFGACMYSAGLALGSQSAGGMGWGYLSVLSFAIGILGGLILFQVLYAGDRIKLKNESVASIKSAYLPTATNKWTEEDVARAGLEMKVNSRALAACKSILIDNENLTIAAREKNLFPSLVKGELIKLEKWKEYQQK